LTIWAVEGGTLSLHDLTYRRIAYPARLAGPGIRKVVLLEVAGLPVDIDEIAQAAAALLYGRSENFTYRKREPLVTN
jgi:hypothetical protein